ncbi:membrane protein [Virgibacillus pantothenticus]|uniref:Bacterial membrane flanked domain protein n=1 Tax=Virgibacillus pantothenticus TaxID=1473 RepID=A0A0L0QRX8_VIRPA|nr:MULTISPECIES: PH domain-containing protein [Virgibacillus]API92076.1 hypothetical protein BKP57_09685 [Virgibacillus sp. 6R]KNE21311.1 bacterial membrane flanked domain protein [Virgibacillus pantothenticus]MBS7430545.1 PH domain-containing protein [Virgibacillus sp. 19R1-5]MBU8566483.1 PH domain-containing protein [Virgibacillus pantothenticus]MBU8600102.1 PH domain-containing protein [Virgibacillus pantothenticus]
MYQHIEEPKQKISQHAINVWRITNTIGHFIFLIIIIVLLTLHANFEWYGWIGYVLWILLGLDIISAIWSVFFEPILLQKYWRYGINKDFVQLKHGKWNMEHQVIPMTKIQYVSLKQGPILRKYGLSSVSIGTMASTHEIPAIQEDEAKTIRDEIAALAKIKEVEN